MDCIGVIKDFEILDDEAGGLELQSEGAMRINVDMSDVQTLLECPARTSSNAIHKGLLHKCIVAKRVVVRTEIRAHR